MLKKIIIFLLTVFLFTACKKTDDKGCGYTDLNIAAPSAEVEELKNYVNGINPAAEQHPCGLFYEITTPGAESVTPSVCSVVTVKYSGYLTNWSKFDENLTGIPFTLGGLIPGWQKGIPLIKKGGKIRLYIPPSLGYGNTSVGGIPPNSILIFDIELVDVQ